MNVRLLLAASLLMAVPAVYAQDAPPAPPASSGPSAPAPIVRTHSQRAPMAGGEMRDGSMRGHEMRGGGEGMRGSLGRLLPEGTWWRNPELVSRIGLTAEQQKHIDDIFLHSRVQLIHMHASLEEEQLLLEPLLNANPVDQVKALAQIGKIADTRAELEKTDAKMLLSIRAVLNADQWTKLQDRHRGMRDGREMGAPGPTRRGYGDRQAPPAPPQ
jgi:Spy/CpxP family protein refolding chaperone